MGAKGRRGRRAVSLIGRQRQSKTSRRWDLPVQLTGVSAGVGIEGVASIGGMGQIQFDRNYRFIQGK
jgi:hypothetical protein